MNLHAAPLRPNLSLMGRSAAVWLFGISLVGLLLVWVCESHMGVIQPSDRIAYPVLSAVFVALLVLVWRHRKHVVLAQRLGTLAICFYFLSGVCAWAFTDDAGQRDYGAATLGPWLMCAHLFIFVSFRGREALMLAGGFVAAIVMLPVLLAAAVGRPSPWDAELWPIIVNVTTAQIVFGGLMAGAVRQVVRLADAAAKEGHSSMPAVLSVEEVLTRRERDLQRLLAASDQAKAQLAASEAELRAMFEAFPGSVCSTDAKGNYRYVNRAYATMWGKKPADFSGLAVSDVLGPEGWLSNQARFARIAATGLPLSFELRHTLPNGGTCDLFVTQFALQPTPAQPLRHYALAIDISDRKAAELAMVDARFDVDRAHRAKSELLAIVQTDLQTPMRTIAALAEALVQQDGLEAPQREQARAIADASAQVIAIVEGLK